MIKKPLLTSTIPLVFTCLLLGFVVLQSCKEEEIVRAEDIEAVTEEALAESFFEDLDDMTSVTINEPSDDEYGGGRKAATITIDDDRFQCAGVVITLTPAQSSTTQNPKGTITVNFGTAGCADARGYIRRGKLILTYTGRRFEPNSVVVITPEDYSINGTTLDGVRTSTNITESTQDNPAFHVTLANGKATFPDATSISRTADITWRWERGSNRLLDERIVDKSSTASGTTRAGKTYAVTLSEDLVYQRTCLIAVDGMKNYVIDGTKDIEIDYGYKDCQYVTIKANRITKSIKVY